MVKTPRRQRVHEPDSVSEIRGRGRLLLRAEPSEEAARVVENVSGVETAEVREGEVHLWAQPESVPEITRALNSERISFSEVRPEQRSLEDVFLELTGEEG